MNIRYLTSQQRKILKKPLGTLFQGSLEEIIMLVKILIEKESPTKIVAVGDQVSQDLTNHSILPSILIVDNRIMRKKIPPISATADNIINVKNPPGTITDEAWASIKQAMKSSQRSKIIVEGEEDLLTLVAILEAPENSLVFYGQPHQGIVVVKVTEAMKQKARKIFEAMKTQYSH